jgi:hypothetical protein
VTGGLGVLLDLLRYAFDRPRLVVGFHMSRSVGEPAVIGIDVTNRGRRPTTILKAAYRPDTEAEMSYPGSGIVIGSGRIDLNLSEGPTVVAAHGGVHQFRKSLSTWPAPLHADDPFRVYVIDSYKNRPTWGPAVPILRMLLNTGWQPPGASPESLEPAPGPIRPKPVEPRWKVWKHKDFRKPPLPPSNAWPPPRDEGEPSP